MRVPYDLVIRVRATIVIRFIFYTTLQKHKIYLRVKKKII